MVQPTHSVVQKGGKRLARDHRPNNSQRYFYVQPSGRSTPSSQSGAAVEGCSTPSSQSGAAVESSSDSSENEDEKDSEEKIAATNAANVRKYGAVSIEEMSSSQME